MAKVRAEEAMKLVEQREAGKMCQCGRPLVPRYNKEGGRIGVTHRTPEEDDHHNAFFAGIRFCLSEQANSASQREQSRVAERLQAIVNKCGWEVEAWGKDTLDVIEQKLEASQRVLSCFDVREDGTVLYYASEVGWVALPMMGKDLPEAVRAALGEQEPK